MVLTIKCQNTLNALVAPTSEWLHKSWNNNLNVFPLFFLKLLPFCVIFGQTIRGNEI